METLEEQKESGQLQEIFSLPVEAARNCSRHGETISKTIETIDKSAREKTDQRTLLFKNAMALLIFLDTPATAQ